ncbi:MAG: hypothetical protein ACI9TH_004001, partial [Kiritimatiellia bacterium]
MYSKQSEHRVVIIIAPFIGHLRSFAGSTDHVDAEIAQAYRSLTTWPE